MNYWVCRNMKSLDLIVLLFALLVEVSAFHDVTNCTEEFQTVLEKALEVKNHCNIRGFYDCCEVITTDVCILYYCSLLTFKL